MPWKSHQAKELQSLWNLIMMGTSHKSPMLGTAACIGTVTEGRQVSSALLSRQSPRNKQRLSERYLRRAFRCSLKAIFLVKSLKATLQKHNKCLCFHIWKLYKMVWEIIISYAIRVEMNYKDSHLWQTTMLLNLLGNSLANTYIERGLGSPVESLRVLKPDRPQVTSQGSLLLAPWPWASYLTSRSLSFLIFKMGIY